MMQTANQNPQRYRGLQSESMSDLLAHLAANSAALVRDEIDLARQELRENARKLMSSVIAATIGATIAGIGLMALIAAAIIGLGCVIGYGLSALVIGFVISVIGIVATLSAVRRIRRSTLTPEKTVETLEENKTWLKELA